MSADNWTYCPKCKKKHETEAEQLARRLERAYRTVPAAEYFAMAKAGEAPEKLDHTLREDYEVGVLESGKFYIRYSCSCTVCGFEFSFKEDRQLL